MAHSIYSYILYALSVASAVQAHAARDADVASPNDLFVRDTNSVPRPKLGSVPYGQIITSCVTPGTVALTYDDGPGPYTAQLLDLLAANGLKATFFILGKSVPGYESVLKRTYAEGHQIASHTYTHTSLESLSSSDRQQEMLRNEAMFVNLIGSIPTYMRPPYGWCYAASGCLSDMGNLGYHVIDWNVDTKDFDNDSPSLIQNAKNNWDGAFAASSPSSASFIPLTHDIHYNTVNVLAPYMIQGIKQKGFRTVTVGECLGDPSQNWYRDPTTGSSVVYKAIAQSSANSTSSVAPATMTTMTSSVSSSRPATVSGTVTSAAASSSKPASMSSSTVSSSTISSSTSSAVSSAASSASSAAATRTNAASQITFDTVLFGILALLYMSITA